MKQFYSLIVFLVAVSFPSAGKAQDYYPDLPSDVSWSPGNFVTVADIQAAFNNARTNENALNLGVGQVQMPMMTMPTQSEWDAKSKSLKALWLINSERVARGLLPFQDVDFNAIAVAQAHANYLMTNNLFTHTGSGGTSPWDRLQANPAIHNRQDFLGVAENLFAFYAWPGPNPLTVERAVYGWNYVDASSAWGHRRALLWKTFTNNYGDAGSEGLMGIGSATGAYGSGCPCNGGGMWPAGDVIVYNIFDPGTTYNPALPVQLASFTGQATSDRRVRLRWTTISEINNYGFYVQRRASSQGEFIDLPNSFLAGHGTTNIPHEYEFVDVAPLEGTALYRLKQVDLAGSVHYSEEISVSVLTGVSEQTSARFSLDQNFPNPFNPTTTIEYDIASESDARLTIYNMLGQEVATLVNERLSAGRYQVNWNATNITSGMYFYRLNVFDKANQPIVLMKKLIVLK